MAPFDREGALKRAEKALRISERRYRVLHDSNPQMIFTVDRAGRVLDVNQAGATRLGYLPHQLIGRSVLSVFDEVHHASVLSRLAACFASPSEVLSWHAVKRAANGREVYVEEAARVVPNLSGGDPHVVIFCTDVTERVRAEESLRQREEQLRRAQKLEAVGTLASGVAHNLAADDIHSPQSCQSTATNYRQHRYVRLRAMG